MLSRLSSSIWTPQRWRAPPASGPPGRTGGTWSGTGAPSGPTPPSAPSPPAPAPPPPPSHPYAPPLPVGGVQMNGARGLSQVPIPAHNCSPVTLTHPRWSEPSPRRRALPAAHAPILEIGAGRGLWAHQVPPTHSPGRVPVAPGASTLITNKGEWNSEVFPKSLNFSLSLFSFCQDLPWLSTRATQAPPGRLCVPSPPPPTPMRCLPPPHPLPPQLRGRGVEVVAFDDMSSVPLPECASPTPVLRGDQREVPPRGPPAGRTVDSLRRILTPFHA